MTTYAFPPLIEVTRGLIVESVHFGTITIVDSNGRLVASVGDPNTVTYLRSTSKPIQVLPFVESGGVEQFGLTERELAIMCASHSGTDDHVAVVSGIQKKLGLREDQLLCGTHMPEDSRTVTQMVLSGEQPTPNRHNCSGKHTGFLAYTLLRDVTSEDYINPAHPIQQTILQTFAEMSGYPVEQVFVGIDGCSAPVFAVPMYNAALAFARLVDPHDLPASRAEACQKVTHAMTTNPDMVAGPGRFDTALMTVGGGKIVCKGGAEGYMGIGLKPGLLGAGSPGLGITIKISDGDLQGRARPVAAVEVLRQLGVLDQFDVEPLAKFSARPVTNWRNLQVGQLRPAFQLDARSRVRA